MIFRFWPPPYSIPSIPASSLLYTCPPPGAPECGPLDLAVTISVRGRNQPGRPFGFTVIAICPPGWALPPYETTLESWANYMNMASLATALLHEVQHADEVVGLNNVCDDYTYFAIEYKTLYLLI